MDAARDTRPLIAHTIYRLGMGGMENGLVNLINRLPRDRFRHAIICLTESGEFEERLDTDNVDVYELAKKPGKDPGCYRRYWQLLRRLRPDVVHTRNLGTLDLAPLAMLAGVPVRIHGEHGWEAVDPTGSSRKYKALRRLCDVAVTRYVTVSNDIADWLGETIHISHDKIERIYNGVDTQRMSSTGDTADLPFPPGKGEAFVVGSIGRFDRIKNFDCLVEAVARILDREPSIRGGLRLLIVGDGPDFDRVRDIALQRGLEDIAWLPGSRNDIPQLLRAMTVFVLPSSNEGISNTILESMATALPIIATAVGGNPELLVEGETGFLIPAKDVTALSEAILHYLRTPEDRERHGSKARKRAVDLFGLDKMVSSYCDLYERQLSRLSSTRIN